MLFSVGRGTGSQHAGPMVELDRFAFSIRRKPQHLLTTVSQDPCYGNFDLSPSPAAQSYQQAATPTANLEDAGQALRRSAGPFRKGPLI